MTWRATTKPVTAIAARIDIGIERRVGIWVSAEQPFDEEHAIAGHREDRREPDQADPKPEARRGDQERIADEQRALDAVDQEQDARECQDVGRGPGVSGEVGEAVAAQQRLEERRGERPEHELRLDRVMQAEERVAARCSSCTG